MTAYRRTLEPLRPILRPRERRRRRRELAALIPVLLQGALMAGAAVLLLIGWARYAAPGMFQ